MITSKITLPNTSHFLDQTPKPWKTCENLKIITIRILATDPIGWLATYTYLTFIYKMNTEESFYAKLWTLKIIGIHKYSYDIAISCHLQSLLFENQTSHYQLLQPISLIQSKPSHEKKQVHKFLCNIILSERWVL